MFALQNVLDQTMPKGQGSELARPEPAAQTPQYKAILRTAVNPTTGQRLGWDGEMFHRLQGVIAHEESGSRFAMLDNGVVLPIHEELPKVEEKSGFWDPSLRTLGIIMGGLNAPVAGIWGYSAAAFGEGKSIPDSLVAGLRSAVNSAFKKGDWGTTYATAYEKIAGRSISEDIDRLLETSEDEGYRHNVYAAKKTLSSLSEPMVDLLVTVMSDPAITVPSAVAQLRRMAGAKPSLAGRQVWTGTGQSQANSGRWVSNESELAELGKEAEGLLKKREDLVNLLTRLKENRGNVEKVNQVIKEAVSTEAATVDTTATKLGEHLMEQRQASIEAMVQGIQSKQMKEFGRPGQAPTGGPADSLAAIMNEIQGRQPKGTAGPGEIAPVEPIKPVKAGAAKRLKTEQKPAVEGAPTAQQTAALKESFGLDYLRTEKLEDGSVEHWFKTKDGREFSVDTLDAKTLAYELEEMEEPLETTARSLEEYATDIKAAGTDPTKLKTLHEEIRNASAAKEGDQEFVDTAENMLSYINKQLEKAPAKSKADTALEEAVTEIVGTTAPKQVKKSYNEFHSEDSSILKDVADWLRGKRTEKPTLTALYRGVPKGSKADAAGVRSGYAHATPWGEVASRGGKGVFADPDMFDVYQYPIASDMLLYRGGALSGDPLESTRILNAKGDTWDNLLDKASELYNTEVLRERKRPGGLTDIDLDHIANSVAYELKKATFEADLNMKPGIWRDETVPRELDRHIPKLRSNDDLRARIDEMRKQGYSEEDIRSSPEWKILGKLASSETLISKSQALERIKSSNWAKVSSQLAKTESDQLTKDIATLEGQRKTASVRMLMTEEETKAHLRELGLDDKLPTMEEVSGSVPEISIEDLAETVGERVEKGKKEPPTTTLGMSGAGALDDMVKKIKNLFPEKPPEQIKNDMEEALFHLAGVVEDVYQPTIVKLEPKAVMIREALSQGWRMYRTKSKKGETWKLQPKGGGEVQTFKTLDEVNEFLGTGTKTAKEYRDALHQMQLEDLSNDAQNTLLEWAFPDGLEGKSPEDIWKAAQRLKRSREKRTLKPGADPVIDRHMLSADIVLGRTPSGKKFYSTLRNAKDEGGRLFSNEFYTFEAILNKFKIGKADLEDVRLALDAKKVKGADGKSTFVSLADRTTNENAKLAAAEIRKVLDRAYGSAKGAGIDVKPYIDAGYFPHKLPPLETLAKGGSKRDSIIAAAVKEGRIKSVEEGEKLLDSFLKGLGDREGDLRYLEWMVKQGQAATLDEARTIWRKYIQKNYSPVSGNLKYHRRADCPFYERDLQAAIGDYLSSTYRSVANYNILGGKNSAYARQYLDRIAREGGNARIARELLDRHLFPMEIPKLSKAAKTVMGFQTVTKLGPLTTALNFTQSLSPALRTSTEAWIKGMANFDMEFAERSGAIMSETLREIMGAHGASGSLTRGYMKAIGFKDSERVLRAFAANVGREHGKILFRMLQDGKRVSYARGEFSNLGINADEALKRGHLTTDELQRIGKRISDETNFLGTDMDMPLGALTPMGRIMWQFKTFVYNQTKLLKRTVVDEARRGNLRPAMFLATAYPAIGMTFDYLVNELIRGKEGPDSPAERYLRGLVAIGGLGLVETMMYAHGYGKFAEQVVGPTIGEIGQAYLKLTSGDVDLAKEALTRTPYLGQFFRAGYGRESTSTARSRSSRSRSGRGR